MDAINSDQESHCECDMWDQEQSGVFVPSILPSVPIGACHTANQNPQEGSVLQPSVVPSVLNDDCWKHILDYVSLEDIELLEAVNGEWQDMVLRYIQASLDDELIKRTIDNSVKQLKAIEKNAKFKSETNLCYDRWKLSPCLSVVLDKLPQLEHLTLDGDVGPDGDVAAAVVRLPRLQELGWYGRPVFRGQELDNIHRDMTFLTSRFRPRSLPVRQGPPHIQLPGLPGRLPPARHTAVRRRRRQGYTQRLQGALHVMLNQRP